ncbi:sialic acid synthase [Natrialba magadii ATCC 43099]|uniref:N-acylneuraminate-9-phosphate synthase n=1 Tax=Natrialba magadii (strain ATCC 43099 / DSM 3394 / CCM 3739 / CIP 104546 / IAM 13178 / JCM 8861 / NBRC 102185 / NCIMB 2190 / MS3) TaxID=547559 RepID=D3SWF1_NATMM|nr:N-acetylneuraminate synthase [Natrialba magadii]ADD03743.1 sialic acid synthase [Natrialba magadii ATCC 43099]ELY33799.1 N-acylneuraminate-9-phosphate synthase [Natrialba magadii ATCC 43099]
MEIDGTVIGPNRSPFFIAEAGVNHNGSLDRAKKLIDVAADAGADAVKFQTFSTDRLVAQDTSTAAYQESATGETDQYEMLTRYELNRDEHRTLLDYCSKKNITFLSTPFDIQSADMLADLGVSAFKIGSGDLDNHPLLTHVAGHGLPMIVSTGMGTLEEIKAAKTVIQAENPSADIVFLHCTSSYPTEVSDVNLRAMQSMSDELEVSVGYSDHTTLTELPALATAAGACILEKHFTLDSTLPGPDHETSLEPDELEEAIDKVDVATTALGDGEKRPLAAEMENRSTARKSIHAAVDVNAGTTLSESDLKVIRPSDGISPRKFESVIGAKTLIDIEQGSPIQESSISFDE